MKTGIFTMKRVLAFTIAVVASMTMLAGGTQPVMTAQNASAESQAIKNNKKKISSAKDKISELEQKQADLDKQINSTKDDISKEEENQKAIQEQIETVQETILTLEDSITDLETEIADLEEAIAKSEIKIKNKRTEIENGVVDFKQRLRAMYVAGNSSYTDILIGSTDFYDMLMKIELVKRVADHDNTMIDGLVELKGEYESQEAELEANKTELETNKATLEEQKAYHTEQKKKLDDLYAKSQAVIDQLEEDKAAYEANKEQINKEQEDFEAQLQKLYKEQEQIKKKEEEERKKKEEEERIAREKAEQEAIDIEPKTEIEYDDFAKMQFQVGEIISCEAVPKSKKLLCSQVKIGSQVRQIVSGIKAHYSPEEMVGKKVMVLVNLKPAKLAGVMSEGMILCAEDAEGNLALVTPEKNMPAGAEIC